MQEALILPSFNRPEMVWFCLDHLAAIEGIEDVPILVAIDAHKKKLPPLQEHVQVFMKFPRLNLHWRVLSPHSYEGNSCNLMTAYHAILQDRPRVERIYMVEDDVMVAPDFLTWHRSVAAPEVSVGAAAPSHGVFASLGVCFSRAFLEEVVVHAVDAYFRQMAVYCRCTFPKSHFGYEQDGLIARILGDRRAIFAKPPVAQHVGWYGYHRQRSRKPTGTLDERYRTVRDVLQNGPILRRWEKDFGDVSPLCLPLHSEGSVGTVSDADRPVCDDPVAQVKGERS